MLSGSVGFWADDEFAIVLLEVGVQVDVVGSGTAAVVVLDDVSIGRLNHSRRLYGAVGDHCARTAGRQDAARG
jgi:hypothetical protein